MASARNLCSASPEILPTSAVSAGRGGCWAVGLLDSECFLSNLELLFAQTPRAHISHLSLSVAGLPFRCSAELGGSRAAEAEAPPIAKGRDEFGSSKIRLSSSKHVICQNYMVYAQRSSAQEAVAYTVSDLRAWANFQPRRPSMDAKPSMRRSAVRLARFLGAVPH